MISKIEKPITKDIRKKQRASDKYQEWERLYHYKLYRYYNENGNVTTISQFDNLVKNI
jgi:hypothetical protein